MERSHYVVCEPEFDIWATAREDDSVRSEFTIGADLNTDEAIALIDAYCECEEQKTSQDQKDPETE